MVNFILITSKDNGFTNWENLSIREQLACEYSDTFKEAYGFRPRGFEGMTAGAMAREIKSAVRAIRADIQMAKENRIQRKLEEARAREATRKATENAKRKEWTLGDFWTQAVR